MSTNGIIGYTPQGQALAVSSSKGTVTLSSRLKWLDYSVVEYIVCHELAHLIEFNHSEQFWAIVAHHIPDYKTRIKRLREAEKHLY